MSRANNDCVIIKFKPQAISKTLGVISGILVDQGGYRDPITEYNLGRDIHVHLSPDGSSKVEVNYQEGRMRFKLNSPGGKEQLGEVIGKVMSGLGRESLLVCPFSGVCGYESKQNPNICRGNHLGCGVYREIKYQSRGVENGS
ncbi:hypothetical protein HY448_00915 [Candidatus Pacearchaeota archaeon]|nr:hypothetical protein [Candidatus Pacearchaeota archaeon]